MPLNPIFAELNARHFAGALPPIRLVYNSRLRASAGRFIPGRRRWGIVIQQPVIEIAHYLLEEELFLELIRDTIGHELIHYWLWHRRRPYGHTPEFWTKMTEMGVSRWNPVPRTRPHKYVYQCPGCEKEFKTRRRLGERACAQCCARHAGGRFDRRFALYLKHELKNESKHGSQHKAVAGRTASPEGIFK